MRQAVSIQDPAAGLSTSHNAEKHRHWVRLGDSVARYEVSVEIEMWLRKRVGVSADAWLRGRHA